MYKTVILKKNAHQSVIKNWYDSDSSDSNNSDSNNSDRSDRSESSDKSGSSSEKADSDQIQVNIKKVKKMKCEKAKTFPQNKTKIDSRLFDNEKDSNDNDNDEKNKEKNCTCKNMKIGNKMYFLERTLYKSNVSKIYVAHTHSHSQSNYTNNCNNKSKKYVIKKYFSDYKHQAEIEYNILKHLNSKYIISIIDKDLHNGTLVMEKYSHDLFDLLITCQQKQKKLSKHSIKKYFTELIDTFYYMQTKNIVHLDIKPENVLLTSDHHIKVIDFGFSLINKDGDSTSKIAKGTPFYAAPELENHTRGYDTFKSDVWSLGVTLYLLLERRRPYNLDKLQTRGKSVDIDHVWESIENEKLVFYCRNEFYKEYHYLISHMLEKNPKYRWNITRVKQENDNINKKYMHIKVPVIS